MNEVFIRAIQHSDLQASFELLHEGLGAGYITQEKLSEHAEPGPKVAYVAATKSGELIATVTGEVLASDASLTAVAHPSVHEEILRLVPEARTHKIGVLESGAVGVPARGSGIGSATSGAVVGELFRQGAECVIAFGWTDAGGCKSEGLLNRIGFEKRGEIAGFWTQDSIDRNYSCPSCEKECKCAASVFVKVAAE